MKQLFVAAFGLMFFTMADAQAVGASQKLNSSISEFDSYTWSRDVNHIPVDEVFLGPDGVIIFNVNTTRSMIKDAIAYELDAKGYDHQFYDYDMVVQFYITEQPGKLRTYNGYQVINSGIDTIRTEENIQQVEIKAGTLLINLINAETGQMMWQGYSSGLLKPDMINDKSKVRQAVSSIFNEFNFKSNTAGN